MKMINCDSFYKKHSIHFEREYITELNCVKGTMLFFLCFFQFTTWREI